MRNCSSAATASAVGVLASLVRAGLAAADREVMRAGGRTIEVVRIRITREGRMTLGES
jgi:hypothetical protein